MQLSLLSLFTALPGFGKDAGLLGGAAAGAEGGDLASFTQWLSDNGLSADMVSQQGEGIGMDWFGDSVANLVLAQGDAAGDTLMTDPAAVLAMLNGNLQNDLRQLSGLTLTPAEAAKLSDLVGQYLQRPDTAAELTEQQRSALTGMLAQLRQAAQSSEPQPIAPILEHLNKALPAHANAKERLPVLSQMVKWLQQVLRDSVGQQQAQAAVAASAALSAQEEADALAKGAALAGFPADGGDAQASEETEETTQDAVAVVFAPTQYATDEVVVDAEPLVTAAPEEILPEVDLPESADADVDAIADQAAKKAGAAVLASIEFASLLEAVPANVQEEAMVRPEMLSQAAHGITLDRKDMAPVNKREAFVLPQEKSSVPSETTQTANAVQAIDQTQSQQQAQTQTSSSTVVGLQSVQHAPAAQVGHVVPQGHVPEAPKHALSEQVQVGIKQISKDGIDRITIQLTPEDMGRVDVRIDVGADGRTHIVFTMDKADAFEQLQRDARFLEKALQDAGVKADAGSMEFNLRQQNQGAFAQAGANGDGSNRQSEPQWDDNAAASGVGGVAAKGDEVSSLDEGIVQNYTVSVNNGLDIRV